MLRFKALLNFEVQGLFGYVNHRLVDLVLFCWLLSCSIRRERRSLLVSGSGLTVWIWLLARILGGFMRTNLAMGLDLSSEPAQKLFKRLDFMDLRLIIEPVRAGFVISLMRVILIVSISIDLRCIEPWSLDRLLILVDNSHQVPILWLSLYSKLVL